MKWYTKSLHCAGLTQYNTARTFRARNVDDFIDFSYLKNFAHALPEKFTSPPLDLLRPGTSELRNFSKTQTENF